MGTDVWVFVGSRRTVGGVWEDRVSELGKYLLWEGILSCRKTIFNFKAPCMLSFFSNN